MSKRRNNLFPSVAMIIVAIIAFLGTFVSGYFSIRIAEIPISATKLAEVKLTNIPTSTSLITQTSIPTNDSTKFVNINILQPSQGEIHPLFKGEYEFAIYSTEPIIVEFIVIDPTNKSIDARQIFTAPEKGFDVILYSPDYTYKKFPIAPINIDSSLNNRYYTKINIPPSGIRFLEGEYTLEIKPNPQYINSPFQFDEKSYLIKFNVENILDTERIFKEVFIAFIIFLILGIVLLFIYMHRYLTKR